MFILSLFLVSGAMAQIGTEKQYRLKSTSHGDYLTIGTTSTNQYGHVYGAAKSESNQNQVFTFIDAGSGKYYLKSVAGKYFSYDGEGKGWNVNATDDENKALAMTFEQDGENIYKIKCYNESKNKDCYFKYEYVNASGKNHPFCDGDAGATWELIDKDADTGESEGEGGKENNGTTDPLADKSIYDYSGFTDANLLTLFYNALQKGRNYPTLEEFENAGIQAADIAFTRSHVRPADILSRADRLVQNTYETRNLFLNIPMDFGKDGSVGQPNTKFHSDVFSMWQYTNLFGAWNKGVFQTPAAWVDAAHRNGTDIMSGIKFFDTTGGRGEGSGTYEELITKKDESKTNDIDKYIYVKPLINCLMYFGADGINYNWEATGYDDPDVVAFHKALYKYAAQVGFTNYHSAIYTSQQGITTGSSAANALYGNQDGKTHDLMLNYNGGDFTTSIKMQQSIVAAEKALGTTEGLYSGVWIAGMDRMWTSIDANPKIGICLWGEHGQSRFWQFNQGNGTYDTQGNYQRLYERTMSGGNRNPAQRPAVSNTGNNWVKEGDKLPLQTFAGLATWIPERSAIQGDMHFLTHFTLGNGDRYYYKGKVSHPGGWYNMGSQDKVPTYRWLRYKSNTTEVSNDIDVNYTHLDAYTGGSCIELTGAATQTGTDIILYKTALKAADGAYAKLAVKTLKNVKATNLYLIIRKQGSNTWEEYPYGDVAGNSWEEKKIDLTGISSGDVIDRIGLRVKGNNAFYQLYVGKLELNDNTTVSPAEIKDLWVEVKKETKSSMTMKLHWDVNATANTRYNWGLVYNDEANIDHFEILYKNGENGKVSLIAKTSTWATTVGNFDFESVNDEPYIGVRAVSTDLKTYSETKWQKVPREAQSSLPVKVEESSYGTSMLDIYSEGIESALKNRFLTTVNTTGAIKNINYSASKPVPDGTNYVDATNHVIRVKQGQTFDLYFKAYDNSDGLKWCSCRAWMDFNGSGDFDHPAGPDEDELSERVVNIYFKEGSDARIQTGYTESITIPNDATPGKSCLRIVFADSWFLATLNPTGTTAKGFSIDFAVEIEGNNPGRTTVDTRDQGEAEEPEDIRNAPSSNVENIESEISTAEGIEGAIEFAGVEKAWIYTTDGKLVKFVNNPTTITVEAGIYLVKMQNGNVFRSNKVLVK